jgi:hypothetical protein
MAVLIEYRGAEYRNPPPTQPTIEVCDFSFKFYQYNDGNLIDNLTP